MTAGRDDRGQVTALLVILAAALVMLVGLVHDGGQLLAGRREATNLARQAARAGAQALDEASVRAGHPTLDPAAATEATESFLRRRGAAGEITVGAERVTVTVALEVPTPLLALAGIPRRTVTATAQATSVRG